MKEEPDRTTRGGDTLKAESLFGLDELMLSTLSSKLIIQLPDLCSYAKDLSAGLLSSRLHVHSQEANNQLSHWFHFPIIIILLPLKSFKNWKTIDCG